MKTLYEITGSILDVNTLLINKNEYESLLDEIKNRDQMFVELTRLRQKCIGLEFKLDELSCKSATD